MDLTAFTYVDVMLAEVTVRSVTKGLALFSLSLACFEAGIQATGLAGLLTYV